MPKKTTMVQESKKKTCSITLNDLETRKSKFEYVADGANISAETYRDIVLFSPSKQSNLGVKISKKLEKHIDEIVHEVVSDLDVKNIYLFSAYASKKEKNNISQSVKNDSKTFLCLYCPSSFLESFYSSIRNALAHGNIVKKGKYYYLFSVSSKNEKNTPDKDKKISFLLKVHDLSKISSYIRVFEKYN